MTRLVPHFEVADVRGNRVSYRDAIWQTRALALVVLPEPATTGDDAYVATFADSGAALAALDAVLILTRDRIPDLPPCAVLIADRWGEVTHVRSGVSRAELPSRGELLDWLDFVQRQCPECQGEAR